MKSVNPFKILFWVLTGIMVVLLGGGVLLLMMNRLVVSADGSRVFGLGLLSTMLLVVLAVMVLIGVLVYTDAKRRGLNPWLWTTVAVFIPNLLGVIIYLIVRFTVKHVCPSCGKGLQGDFRLCPYCGSELALHCSACGKPVSSDWKLCPHCGRSLVGEAPGSE